jgi:hypothetical protein
MRRSSVRREESFAFRGVICRPKYFRVSKLQRENLKEEGAHNRTQAYSQGRVLIIEQFPIFSSFLNQIE